MDMGSTTTTTTSTFTTFTLTSCSPLAHAFVQPPVLLHSTWPNRTTTTTTTTTISKPFEYTANPRHSVDIERRNSCGYRRSAKTNSVPRPLSSPLSSSFLFSSFHGHAYVVLVPPALSSLSSSCASAAHAVVSWNWWWRSMRPHDASIPTCALTNATMNSAPPTSHFSSSLQPFSAPDSVPVPVPTPADAVVDAVTTTFISSNPDPASAATAATTDAATSAISSAVNAVTSSSGEALLDLSGISVSVPSTSVPVPPTPPFSAIPIPDDKAVEMVTYALSGPGIIAFVAVLSLVAFMFLSFAELGPLLRNSNSNNRSRNDGQQHLIRPFILRVTVYDCNPIVELPEGGVQRLHDGVETVLRFHSHQAAEAVAKQLQRKVHKHRPRSTTDENMNNKRVPPPPLEYTLFRLNGLTIKTIAQWPRPINAPGAKWPEINSQSQQQIDVDVKPEELQQMWDEYERIDAIDHVDRQWQDFVRSLGSVSTDEIEHDGKGPCRLCGGSGFTKCYRCGGMYSSNAAQTQGNHLGCDCLDGRRPCEWCSL